ncbi:putative toxin-antitoxin system toxin component, PIN family [Dethiobacter alkaliphilus]|uniref:putative toxin-antitoxin system toxin component, PIN family n=1 Tax=Dethiobacter alkaliphilus TaxID=427926 RepID=UPI002225F23B|nr:putative toxin-antitoxin system toxin component, PIN family [Dethiobacter alkaliphilus]MCW3490208.1 putative toxin-antitoxin system toxin component, PIN family [Dethiobacter alkaliphilus]
MKIVLDTNVLVSGLLKAFSSSGTIVRMISAGSLTVVYDARIISEYRDVLHRPNFGFKPSEIEALLAQIKADGITANVQPLQFALPDKDDEPFLEASLAEKAILVTGNKKHYTIPTNLNIQILSPTDFLNLWQSENN